MKKVIFIFCLMILSQTNFAQQPYELPQRTGDLDSVEILKMRKELDSMRFNLNQAHSEFSTGTVMIFSGYGLMLGGFAMGLADNAKTPSKNPIYLIGFGATLKFVGELVQMDSHKFFGFAGREPNRKPRIQ